MNPIRVLLYAMALMAPALVAAGNLVVRTFHESPPETGAIQCMELRYEAQTFNLVCPRFWRGELSNDGLRFRTRTDESHILISFSTNSAVQTNLDFTASVFAEIGHRPITVAPRFEQPTGLGAGTGFDFDWQISGLAMKGRCVVVEANDIVVTFLLLAPRAGFSTGQQVLGALLGSFQAGSKRPVPR